MKLSRRSTLKIFGAMVGSSLFPVLRAQASGAMRFAPRAAENVESRVDSILSQMTLEEKIAMIGGLDEPVTAIRGLPRLGVPKLHTSDGPLGVRSYGPSTAYAAGIALAATWDPELAQRVGIELGRDARARGVNVLLGPGLNIYRAPMNGRNFEYFGEDPWLASRMAVGYIRGVQSQGVSCTAKHFVGNNSEYDRHNTDAIIDERTLREIYLPAFEAAVKEAHVGAVMDAYSLVNGQHMTQNNHLNNVILKGDWKFDGIVMSDWDAATYDGIAAANGGLDLEMSSARFMNRKALLPAIAQGKVTVATIDDKVRRILRKEVEFGWLDREQTDLSVPRYNQQGREVSLEVAREGMVLLKNDKHLLPLDQQKVKNIAVIGPDAYPSVTGGGGSGHVQPFAAVSFLQGVSNYLGVHANTTYDRGIPSIVELARETRITLAPTSDKVGWKAEYFTNTELKGAPVVTRSEDRLDRETPVSSVTLPDVWASVRWTGYYHPQGAGAHELVMESEEQCGYRVYIDDKLAMNNWRPTPPDTNFTTIQLSDAPHKIVVEYYKGSVWSGDRVLLAMFAKDHVVRSEALAMAKKADVVLLAVGFNASSERESVDRTFRLPPGQERLIEEITAANPDTIVAITSGGAVDMTAWLNKPAAVLQTWFSGQEGGRALAEILFGDVNPSGHLPATFERRWEDNPVHDSYYPKDGSNRVVYKEGIFVGYRGYEHNHVEPLFPFGYGLSYTTFAYRNLSIAPVAADGSVAVSFDVTNTGSREGATVAQVYVGEQHAPLPRPEKELKGFARVTLAPGATRRVTVNLNARAFAYFDVRTNDWRIDAADFQVMVGSNVEQIELQGNVAMIQREIAR